MKTTTKLKLYIFLFSILPLATFAQNKMLDVYGRVLSQKRVPVANAIIRLKKTNIKTTTDNKGSFHLKSPYGKQTLFIISSGIEKSYPFIADRSKKQVTLPDIILDDQPTSTHALDEVVITGQYQARGIRNSIYRAIVLDKKFIEQKQATDVESILNTNVGLYFPHDMALGTSNIQIMGMGGNNVKILLDDMPLFDRNGSKQSLEDIDVNTIERIEVVYGPMSVIYGSDALAGVINIITKKRLKQGLSLELSMTEESVGKEYSPLRNEGLHKKGLRFGYGFKNGFFLNGAASARDFGGWRNKKENNRARTWFPKTSNIFQLGAGYVKDRLDIKAKQMYSQNTVYNLSNIMPGSLVAGTKKYITDRYNTQVTEKYQLSENVKFKLDCSYQYYKRRTETYVNDLKKHTRKMSDGAGEQDKMYFTSFFARLISKIKATDNLSIIHGLEVTQETGKGNRIEKGSEIIASDMILSAEYAPVSWGNISGGLRKSIVSTYTSPMFIPSVNLKLTPTSWMDLRFSYAKGFRAPKLDELYMSFHDTNHNIDGNKNLKPEKSHTVSVSASFYPKLSNNISFSSTLSSSFSNYKNYIELFEIEDSINYYTYENLKREKILLLGLENKLKWESFSASLNIGATGRLTPKFAQMQTEYPNIKRFKFNAEISSNLSYDISNRSSISLFYKYAGPKFFYSIAEYNTIIPKMRKGYHYGDITFAYSFLKNKNLRCTIGIKNLFNVKSVRSNMESVANQYHGGGNVASIGYGRYLSFGVKYSL